MYARISTGGETRDIVTGARSMCACLILVVLSISTLCMLAKQLQILLVATQHTSGHRLLNCKPRKCLQCPANSHLAGNKCPVAFRDYKNMRIHVQQDHAHLEPQPAICICSLSNVSTSDACKKSGCAWFFVDDISDDTTIADWYPGMDMSTEDTRPNPLPFPWPSHAMLGS
jgi:hypothetical protein